MKIYSRKAINNAASRDSEFSEVDLSDDEKKRYSEYRKAPPKKRKRDPNEQEV